MKKFFKSLDWVSIILSIYASLVWFTFIYFNKSVASFAIVLSLIIFFINYFLIKWLGEKIKGIELTQSSSYGWQKNLALFAIPTLLVFGIMMIWFWSYLPGSYSADSITQLRQTVTGQYNDWHPAWHTLFFFTFPLWVTGKIESIIFMQVVYYSLLLGYLFLTISQLSRIKYAIVALVLLVTNPFNCYMVLYAWKDIGFSLFAAFCTIFVIRLITKISKPSLWKLIIFGFVLASTTIFRHNAILYTLPLLLLLRLQTDKKTWIKTAAFILAFFIAIKGPIYSVFDVQNPDRRVSETVGLPLSIIGNVAYETPDRMDKELSEFVYTLAPAEIWQQYDVKYGFNSVKWKGVNIEAVEDQGYAGILSLTMQAIKASPQASFRAFIAVTDLLYGFESGLRVNYRSEMNTNDLGVDYSPYLNQTTQDYISAYTEIYNNSMLKYLRDFGIYMFVLLVVYLYKLNWKSWASWKRFLMILPLFAHNFGTMLLSTAPEPRFYFITNLVAPILIVYVLVKEKRETNV
ncbi:MAG: hypothetical protein K5773_08060 [Pseudobutyrivibrio sp.]|nr:hypothetical protein [Pseudobutyrivibrio sp.]